jgi:hypothetical protein
MDRMTNGMPSIAHPDRLVGFAVAASDGRLGHVVEADPHAIVIRVRRRHLVIPARAIEAVDEDGRTVRLNRTRRQAHRIPQPASPGGARVGGWFGGVGFNRNPPVLPGPPAGGDPPDGRWP